MRTPLCDLYEGNVFFFPGGVPGNIYQVMRHIGKRTFFKLAYKDGKRIIGAKWQVLPCSTRVSKTYPPANTARKPYFEQSAYERRIYRRDSRDDSMRGWRNSRY